MKPFDNVTLLEGRRRHYEEHPPPPPTDAQVLVLRSLFGAIKVKRRHDSRAA